MDEKFGFEKYIYNYVCVYVCGILPNPLIEVDQISGEMVWCQINQEVGESISMYVFA